MIWRDSRTINCHTKYRSFNWQLLVFANTSIKYECKMHLFIFSSLFLNFFFFVFSYLILILIIIFTLYLIVKYSQISLFIHKKRNKMWKICMKQMNTINLHSINLSYSIILILSIFGLTCKWNHELWIFLIGFYFSFFYV